ncbi:hypothetical protein ES708_17853 [subsurface metagenome]
MLYYTTYRLRNGEWKPTIIFKDELIAEIEMNFHAKDRGYIIAKSEKELERRKKNRSLPERKEKKYKETEK